MKPLPFLLFLLSYSTLSAQKADSKDPIAFLPDGYVLFEQIHGDLNNDELEDCVLLIKDTDKNQIVSDEYYGSLDRNRRGLIILFNKGGHYEMALKNETCFSSENEPGGVYFPPDLWIEIENNKLYIHYGHGRYGFWRYTFRYRKGDFDLIGYDSSENFGPVVQRTTSINFLTKKKRIQVNTNRDDDGGEEVFEETWHDIAILDPMALSEVEDFDDLDMGIY